MNKARLWGELLKVMEQKGGKELNPDTLLAPSPTQGAGLIYFSQSDFQVRRPEGILFLPPLSPSPFAPRG